MTFLSATAIVLINGPIVGSPSCFASFLVVKIPVDTVSKMPMAARDWSCRPMMSGVSCVLKVCILEMGSLKYKLCTWVWWLVVGLVWTGEAVSHIR